MCCMCLLVEVALLTEMPTTFDLHLVFNVKSCYAGADVLADGVSNVKRACGDVRVGVEKSVGSR